MFGIKISKFNLVVFLLSLAAVYYNLAFNEGNELFLGAILFIVVIAMMLNVQAQNTLYYESFINEPSKHLGHANKRIRELEDQLKEAQTKLAEAENNFGKERILSDGYYNSVILYMEKVDEWKELLDQDMLSELAISLEKGIAHED